jgi:hypothetical protein
MSIALTASPVAPPRRTFSGKNLALAAPLAGGLAAASNYAVYALAKAAGADFTARFDPSAVGVTELPLAHIAVSSLLPALLGAGVLAVLNLLTTKAERIFIPLAAVLAVASCAGPLLLEGAGAGTKAAFVAMHLVAAAAITGVLLRRGRA